MTDDINSNAQITGALPAHSRILVTGACGSVGSALIERLISDGHIVCAFDQSEDGLFQLDQRFTKSRDQLRLFLGNVRDEARIRRAMDGVDVVFHCAALKHVYLSEYNPFEAMQTNIIGTNNIIQAAIAANVDRVILTSSDKAVNPTSTMGATKLLGERLFIAANHYTGSHETKFVCVRFGNVLNSNGSVLQIFRRQLENNMALTITSKDMTRFFLNMSQAVELCINAATRMIGGEIFVRNMGACDILTLAQSLNGEEPLNYEEIGHKPGEKLFEELVTENEAPRTILIDDTYVILPDTMDLMPEDLQEKYQEYNELPRLVEPLRSDQDLMSEQDVISMLRGAKVIV